MKLGTSLRFIFPTGPQTYQQFKQNLATMPPGSFIERPMGAFDTAEQAENLLEVAAAARDAELDGLLVGDNHAIPAGYANCFSPLPTLARLMAATGEMSVGAVLLAPFYQPVLLAEQIGTISAFARGPLIVTLANGGNERAFAAYGLDLRSRARRLEELATVLRALLAGERVSFRGRYITLDGVRISPLPRVPVEIWLAGTVPSAAARAGRLGDAWLTGQNATDADVVQQLAIYRDAAAAAGRTPRAVLRRDIFVAESDAEAHAEVDRVLAEGYRGTGKDELLVGSPDSVVERLRAYRKLGFEEAMVRHITGDHRLMLRSFALIGKHVMPAIRDL
ncbi:MAG TPA: LLM class flavin-dependent oxidoreductase [Dehalococcoidia bacterium]|jgi:alkanesulfonate monooxygenase SsuD/methylene tetrahydromethanopterin reductase-like flavin-dependent oxidoreductase (luciferase family)